MSDDNQKRLDRPVTAADKRPFGSPFYIDSECPDCGEELVLHDKLNDDDVSEDDIWHDEWACPNDECGSDSIFLDVPNSYADELASRLEEDAVPLEDADTD